MQEATLYRHILREAWGITWKNKFLWILGFLAVFWGDLGAYHSLNQTIGGTGPSLSEAISQGQAPLVVFKMLSFSGFATLLGAMFIVFLLLGTLVVLATSGRGGLIYAIAKRHQKKTVEGGSAFKRGLHVFLPLLGIGILTRLDVLLYIFLVNPLIIDPPTPASFTLYLIAFVVVTLISLILSFLGIYASALILLEGYSFKEALRGSFGLFLKHWLVSIELGLLLYLLTLAVGIVVLITLFVLGIPFVLLGVIASLLGFKVLVFTILILAAVIYVLFLLIVGSAFVTFQYATWTLLFLRIQEDRAFSKVVRLTSRFAHILHRKLI